jgi:hypothetical protein
MRIAVKNDKPETEVQFDVDGAYPDTVYTIWIVFNTLKEPLPTTGISVPSISASTRAGFPREGNGVSPMAPMNSAFTAGMGMDPGASFVTDKNGKGKVNVKLDYDLIQGAPVSSNAMIPQCVPVPGVSLVVGSDGKATQVCTDPASKMLRITTTWLRRFIAEFPVAQRAGLCANYNATFDPESGAYDPIASKGMNARWWQCIDPANGLPRVHMYAFDHFRLANHPDDLTHGFIGGNGVDHWIDMVGRRADVLPKK